MNQQHQDSSRSQASSSADVLVVGAGAIGASTAYHLAARGLSVTIVDQFEAASQTSPRAAGLSTTVSRDPNHAPLAQRSADMIENLEAEIGYGVPFKRTGTIRLTRSLDYVDNVREEIARGTAQGLEVEEIGGDRASQLAPFLRSEPVAAMTYVPSELYLPDPGDIARAYLAAARDLGVRMVPGSKVHAFTQSGGRIMSTRSAEGFFSAGSVILCANAGNGRLVDLLGARLPTIPFRHQLCITEPLTDVEAHHPQVKVVDGRMYVRPHGRSLLVGGFEPDPLVFTHQQADAADMRQFRLDSRPLTKLLTDVADVLPSAASASIDDVRGGIVSMTPDGRFILDRVPGLDNAWIVGGDNAGGNTTSPMIGQVMSEWIVDGAPSQDLGTFRFDRFSGLSSAEATRLATRQYEDMIALD